MVSVNVDSCDLLVRRFATGMQIQHRSTKTPLLGTIVPTAVVLDLEGESPWETVCSTAAVYIEAWVCPTQQDRDQGKES